MVALTFSCDVDINWMVALTFSCDVDINWIIALTFSCDVDINWQKKSQSKIKLTHINIIMTIVINYPDSKPTSLCSYSLMLPQAI